MVELKEILKMEVIDKAGQEVGKVKEIEFDETRGQIKNVTIDLDECLFSNEKRTVGYDQIRNITDNVLLNIVIDLDH
ncbi:hypothetical protein ALNOE001_05510 [Candidatus Methanobinarius endosymbioticus]|uniref:PRC-barrel domain-containing protein n=1 Tax=Candidatus Methanobinarius endosymbioticus TaxID=2006182 RepID=A0A366MDW5_9EURY|nr:hypothetical protein ALNOE001_05510 [Candidatus Methanobinarius endosymbioticus]